MKNTIKSLKNEVWKTVRLKKATNKRSYAISNFGRIKSIVKTTRHEELIDGSKDNRGMVNINLRFKDGTNSRVYVHRFVAKNFVKQKTKKHMFILHKNHDKENNRKSNLVWATEDKWKAHLKLRPGYAESMRKRRKSYKLTESKVRTIKKMLQKGKVKQHIAERYGITATQVRRIETGENWAHVAINR